MTDIKKPKIKHSYIGYMGKKPNQLAKCVRCGVIREYIKGGVIYRQGTETFLESPNCKQ